MSEPRDVMVVCSRCTESKFPPRGSTREKCSKCGADVWLSPGTRRTVAALGAPKFVCVPCSDREIATAAKKDGVLILPRSRAQDEEIKRYEAERN